MTEKDVANKIRTLKDEMLAAVDAYNAGADPYMEVFVRVHVSGAKTKYNGYGVRRTPGKRLPWWTWGA